MAAKKPAYKGKPDPPRKRYLKGTDREVIRSKFLIDGRLLRRWVTKDDRGVVPLDWTELR